MGYKVTRYHDISTGHRVAGHESKCRHLHGHNYRIHFTCVADSLDDLGRVIDFSVIKEKLCMWVEDNWDHKFLHWEKDPVIQFLKDAAQNANETGADHWIEEESLFTNALVAVPFNPTAENMAQYLVEVIGPRQLKGTGVRLIDVTIEETAKCHASFTVK